MNLRIRTTTSFLIFAFAIIGLSSCGKLKANSTVQQEFTKEQLIQFFEKSDLNVSELKSGDLILRRGFGIMSETIEGFSEMEKKYSHSGLIGKDENGTAYVYHILGATDGKEYVVRKDELFKFCNANDALSFAVYRYDMNEEQIADMKTICENYYHSGIQFDLSFDLTTNDRMYCSEFVYKSLIEATGNSAYIPLTKRNDEFIVAIDNLYLNNHTKKVFEYDYNN